MQGYERHNFDGYLRSFSNELNVTKDRVRQLVRHWPTDGHFKEGVLRQFLRRHLPESVLVGTGFVVNSFGPSGEIDVLVVDKNKPTLFKDGELLIVTPESVKVVLEVKTSLRGPSEVSDALEQLAERKAVVTRHVECQNVLAGLFVYDGDDDRHKTILESLRDASQIIDLVSYGQDTFVKYFKPRGDGGQQTPDNAWHSFDVQGLAPANFIASIIERVVPNGQDCGSFAWFHPIDNSNRRSFVQRHPNSLVSDFNP